MKPRLSLLALAAMLAGCPHASTPPAAEVASPQAGGDSAPTAPADAPQPANTRLTVYSGDYEQLAASGDFDGDAPGFVLVDRTLRYALKAGANRISASLFAPGNTIASVVALEFPEAVQGSLRLQSLLALGFILFVISFIVLFISRLLLRPRLEA